MGIQEPRIEVICDGCNEAQDFELTKLAGDGWDARNLQRKLARYGWRVNGDITICPECDRDEQENAKA